MKTINPKEKIKPFLNDKSHARLRHDYALWHPEIVEKTINIKDSKNRIPYEGPSAKRSRFDSYSIALEAIEKSVNYPSVVNKDGYLETTFSLEYEVGYDVIKECRTKTVTVVTKIDGSVITAFPGLPKKVK
jgi:hypothetical protein